MPNFPGGLRRMGDFDFDGRHRGLSSGLLRRRFVQGPELGDPHRRVERVVLVLVGLWIGSAVAGWLLFWPWLVIPIAVVSLYAARISARFRAARAPVTVPTYAGKHGHPVCIARPLIAELLALTPEDQASDVIHRHVDQTSYIEVPDSSSLNPGTHDFSIAAWVYTQLDLEDVLGDVHGARF